MKLPATPYYAGPTLAPPSIEVASLRYALEDEDRGHWKIWLAVGLFVLLCHYLFSLLDLKWTAPLTPPMPIDIHQVDPAKLEQIKKQWKRQQSILLDQDKNRPNVEAPKNARYFSDKNIRVEKEQRAKETNVIPHQGMAGPRAQAEQKAKPEKSQPRTKSLPDLSSLGVPMQLNQAPPPREDSTHLNQREQDQTYRGDEGGDQALNDKDLPPGAQNMLNAEESVYYSFYSRMYEVIAPVWQSRVREVTPNTRINPGDYTTVVDVVLDKEGNLIAVNSVHTSGVPVLDQAVDSSWHKTGHFPNPPKALLNAQGEVHTGWTFTVQLSQGTGLQYMPPERVY